jgi:hypothetical protein
MVIVTSRSDGRDLAQRRGCAGGWRRRAPRRAHARGVWPRGHAGEGGGRLGLPARTHGVQRAKKGAAPPLRLRWRRAAPRPRRRASRRPRARPAAAASRCFPWRQVQAALAAAARRLAPEARAGGLRAAKRNATAAALAAAEPELLAQLEAAAAEHGLAAGARSLAARCGCNNPACGRTAGLTRARAKGLFPAQRCNRCNTVRYCGVECQRAGWPARAAVCRALLAGAGASAAAGEAARRPRPQCNQSRSRKSEQNTVRTCKVGSGW